MNTDNTAVAYITSNGGRLCIHPHLCVFVCVWLVIKLIYGSWQNSQQTCSRYIAYCPWND